jgi:hypothetical protein
MKKETAQEIRDFSLAAIEALSCALNAAASKCNEQDTEILKKAVGLSIMKIDSDVLGFIYEKYPELDDLGESRIR